MRRSRVVEFLGRVCLLAFLSLNNVIIPHETLSIHAIARTGKGSPDAGVVMHGVRY